MSGADESERHSRERDRSRRESKSRELSDGSRDQNRSRSNDRTSRKNPSDRRVYVSNIPYEFRWQDVKDLFREQVGNVAFVEIFFDEYDKSRGCAIVEFEEPESVEKCLEVMHRFDLKGRKLVVKEDHGNERDKHGYIITGRRDKERMNFHGDVRGPDRSLPSLFDVSTSAGAELAENYGNTYGLSTQFLKSLGIFGPLVNFIFVSNLDYKVDEKKLSEVFRLAGKVLNINLSRDKSGASKGFAVIEYDHPVESVQAISMLNNQMLYTRNMSIRMDREYRSDLPIRLPEGLKNCGRGLGPNGTPLRNIGHMLSANSASNASAAGNLGTVPTQSLQTARLNNLGSQTSALQASLVGVGGLSNPLIGRNISNVANELSLTNFTSGGLGASLMSNPLTQNTNLTASMTANNTNPLGNSGNFRQQNTNFSSNFLSTSNSGNRLSFDNSDDIKSRDYRSYGTFLTSSRISDTIVVSNLPSTATWQTLREKFQNFGDIKYAEMKGIDTGMIRFSDEMCAKEAVDMMNRTRVDGRTIDVRFY